jgi:hypothetical protein
MIDEEVKEKHEEYRGELPDKVDEHFIEGHEPTWVITDYRMRDGLMEPKDHSIEDIVAGYEEESDYFCSCGYKADGFRDAENHLRVLEQHPTQDDFETCLEVLESLRDDHFEEPDHDIVNTVHTWVQGYQEEVDE